MRMTPLGPLVVTMIASYAHAFVPAPFKVQRHVLYSGKKEWTSDFDDFYIDDDEDDPFSMSNILQKSSDTKDLSACRARQFSLGPDLVLSDFCGSMGFDKVTDWEYYYRDEDTGDKKVVPPPPLDPSKPKRTRDSSGSVVRIFRGEFVGRLGATLRSQGLEARILVKEFSGSLALELAQAELASIATLQNSVGKDDWVETAISRSALQLKDNTNVGQLVNSLKKTPYCGILGEVNLAELEGELDANEFYRALGVQPPKPGSIWIVYEYVGLSTVASYSRPAEARVAQMPPRKGPLGNVIPPPTLPPWKERARYVVQGIIKGALEAVATLHEAGIAHRSIGRSSVLIASMAMDKREASSPYATNLSRLQVKLADFGFSSPLEEKNEEMESRARSFGLSLKDESSIKAFSMAEDLNALGFVVLGLLLTSLAEPPSAEYTLPATDEDTLQRLLTDIFEKDMDQFRDYVQAEEVWSNVVQLLDDKDGWEFLEALLFARESVAEKGELVTARGLLSSPFLQR